MQQRKEPLVKNHFYHIYSRSIAKYTIFNNDIEFERMLKLFDLYRFANFNYKYSRFIRFNASTQKEILNEIKINQEILVSIIAYCLMPTHLHLILRQNEKNGITNFMSRILNSYSRYFNVRHQRVGPLWSGRFKNVLIKTDEQLLHLTRYIHLNPTSAGLIKNPEDWQFSSYREYINNKSIGKSKLCQKNNLFNIGPKKYKKFVEDRKKYQQKLSKIKNLLIDQYSG